MAVKKDVQARTEAKANRMFNRGLARLQNLGVVKNVPRDLQQAEAEAMRANPALITAKVAELAQGMPLERAQLQVAQQLMRFQKEQS